MLNFTVGPVMRSREIIEASLDIPYFRTPEFSSVMFENEMYIKKYFKASNDAKVIFLTGSGTAAMDAVVSNTLTKHDNVLVINGGSFGHRFVELCETYEISYTEIKCSYGKTLTKEQLYQYDNGNYSALLVNLDETSTAVLYDINMISEFCKKNNLFLIVDSISSFLCDEFDMEKLGVNIVLTGSQKALALAPGISIICADNAGIERINNSNNNSYYLNLKLYLKNMERGQTPFTPAVGILLELNKRLIMIDENGGVDEEIKKTAALASYFRKKIENYPFELFADKMSNAVTSLKMRDDTKSAYKVFEILKDEYGIFICPNAGELRDIVFRVGHLGHISKENMDTLFLAFDDMLKRNLI